MPVPLVIGVDAGGTTTRCVAASLDGAVVGRGLAGGANAQSSGASSATALVAAVGAALSGLDPSLVVAGVVGRSGAVADGTAGSRGASHWAELGVDPSVMRVVTDLEVAYAAGTPSPSGLLLLSGTGAAAVAFRAGGLHARCDGYGWLLGDDGSAVWLGREAVRAVLRAVDGRGAPTALAEPVLAALCATADPVAPPGPAVEAGDPAAVIGAVLRSAYREPPAALGRLAPLVGVAALDGDAVAQGIVAQAADRLLESLDAASRHLPAGESGPVVLAGSVLLAGGPVASRVRAGVRERFEADPAEARDGAAGAASLAIAAVTGAPISGDIHARLVG
ncbi:BadF/BadG/BcrA/BcrD ATPase family protein [Dactylosporangium sp. AC04546]|uniref:N-acetylglucosamine kinase n=1 Tax=Dactylosporangium sp. AC04546 TaxID=2862460 RepID=UPI001EDFD33E|nr:BadF/BadG/BcrA/BcrD ATPase family protein [Dactylosporangium sp. AC04546]WVK78385.1 BadF/BadG/BcrA/BcrD ATPase family protein [Dactylosporangium sp. AC04546]